MIGSPVRLSEVADLCLGKMLDKEKNKGNLRPYLANINVRWGSLDLQDLREMRFEDRELERYGLRSGDIIMCEGGEPGRCVLWKDQMPGMMIQKALHRIRPFEGVNSQFLYYALSHKGRTGGLNQYLTGATIKHLPGEQLAKIEVVIPSVETQRRIASILGAYDDLIEVNRRRVAILEEMARELFEEWFVRFRFPGNETLQRIETEHGVLPEGWRFCDLAELCPGKAGIQTGPFGSQLHQEDYSTEGIAVVMPKNIASLRIDETGIARIPPSLALALARHLMAEGDIVYGRRGDIGRRAYVPGGSAMWFCGTGCLRLRPDPVVAAPRYLFQALGTPLTEGSIKGRAQGATMPNLSVGVMKSVPVLAPPIDLQHRFASIVAPASELARTFRAANDRLAASRDLLLPRLISGQLSVASAERYLEEAA